MGPRTNLSLTMVAAAAVLLVSIAIGNEMGNRVLGQATERGPAILATPVASPIGADDPSESDVNWRHSRVVSVATDPAFPDPRITPEPAPPPPPTRAPTAAPTPTPSPTPSRPPYTSPPLPIPLVTPASEATGEPETAAPQPAESG